MYFSRIKYLFRAAGTALVALVFFSTGPVYPADSPTSDSAIQVGDELSFASPITIYEGRDAAALVETESTDAFLVLYHCGARMVLRNEGPARVLAHGVNEAYEVTDVQVHDARGHYRVQKGWKFQLRPLFTPQPENRIQFVICFKESHEEHQPRDPSLSGSELGDLLEAGQIGVMASGPE